MPQQHHVSIEPSPKRVRVMANGKTVADSLCTRLLLETGHMPVYYFPREDVRMDLLEPTNHRTRCPSKGEASYWNLNSRRTRRCSDIPAILITASTSGQARARCGPS
jgi:uncharacterized protein (DUF427 family)